MKKLVSKSSHPITAIGGINVDNAQDVFNAGACGIAVIEAIHNSTNPYETAKNIMNHALDYDRAFLMKS